jgi:hypothetical protein
LVTPCSTIVSDLSNDRNAFIFRVKQFHDTHLEDAGTTIPRAVGNYIPVDTAHHPRRHEYQILCSLNDLTRELLSTLLRDQYYTRSIRSAKERGCGQLNTNSPAFSWKKSENPNQNSTNSTSRSPNRYSKNPRPPEHKAVPTTKPRISVFLEQRPKKMSLFNSKV